MRRALPRRRATVKISADGGIIEVRANDKVLGELSHPDLTPALLKIWLGKKPAQESLKKALLGLS